MGNVLEKETFIEPKCKLMAFAKQTSFKTRFYSHRNSLRYCENRTTTSHPRVLKEDKSGNWKMKVTETRHQHHQFPVPFSKNNFAIKKNKWLWLCLPFSIFRGQAIWFNAKNPICSLSSKRNRCYLASIKPSYNKLIIKDIPAFSKPPF